jgi:D-alanyl-D-alanine dipeptidase
VDILVCNHALTGVDGPLGELSAAELDQHWAVDARSNILLAQAFAAQHDGRPGGNVVFLTSGQHLEPLPGEVAYAAAEAALAGITTTLADQLVDRGIRLNTVNPGPVDTGYLALEMWRAAAPMPPFGRYGDPDDPARLISWLVTDEARWITGQVINTEGGSGRWHPAAPRNKRPISAGNWPPWSRAPPVSTPHRTSLASASLLRQVGMTRRSGKLLRLVAAVVAAAALLAPQAQAAPAAGEAPEEFVALRDVAPTVIQEIRYHGSHNFVGHPIPGYREPECLLTRPAAEALRDAQRKLLPMGYSLKVYDCFRPQRSVDFFVRWSEDPSDQRMKEEFYPRIDKERLFPEGYIAEQSGHSRGSTVDLTLVELPVRPQRPFLPGEPLTACYAPHHERFPDNSIDMGTGYDCFDELAHTDDPRVEEPARRNRQLLKSVLESVGMENYPYEWWHFTLVDEPFPDTYFDFPVSRGSLRG